MTNQKKKELRRRQRKNILKRTQPQKDAKAKLKSNRTLEIYLEAEIAADLKLD